MEVYESCSFFQCLLLRAIFLRTSRKNVEKVIYNEQYLTVNLDVYTELKN